MMVLPHCPYSSDLSPPHIHLFRVMKSQLKRRVFNSMDEVKDATTIAMNSILENDFQRCFKESAADDESMW